MVGRKRSRGSKTVAKEFKLGPCTFQLPLLGRNRTVPNTRQVWHIKKNPFRNPSRNWRRHHFINGNLRETCANLFVDGINMMREMTYRLPIDIIKEIQSYIPDRDWKRLLQFARTDSRYDVKRAVLVNPPFACTVCGSPTILDDYCFLCYMAYARSH